MDSGFWRLYLMGGHAEDCPQAREGQNEPCAGGGALGGGCVVGTDTRAFLQRDSRERTSCSAPAEPTESRRHLSNCPRALVLLPSLAGLLQALGDLFLHLLQKLGTTADILSISS